MKINYKKLSKKRRQILIYSVLIILSITLSYVVSTPVTQIQRFAIHNFEIYSEDASYESGKTLIFRVDLSGGPETVLIIFGDGEIKDVSELLENNNGFLSGEIEHIYSLQGRYTPIIQVWNAYGRYLTKSLDLTIQNNEPLFTFSVNSHSSSRSPSISPLKTSAAPLVKVFEDEEIKIEVNASETHEDLTYIYHFGDAQETTTNNVTYYTWKNQGIYPVSVSVMGSQGELRKESMNVEVQNREPTAYFTVGGIKPFQVGSVITFNAEKSNDTSSDLASLRYLWDLGDGVLEYGKKISHTYSHAGTFNVTLSVKDNDGEIAVFSRLIEVINTLPEIKLEDFSLNHTIKEGEPVIFQAKGSDDSYDIIDLLYYWNFNSKEFNPHTLQSYIQGGNLNLHYFEDDFEGNVTAAVLDLDHNFAVDSTYVQVENVAPELNIYQAYYMSNISFSIIRNSTDSSLNTSFLVQLLGDNATMFRNELTFSDNTSLTITTATIPFPLVADKNWKVAVNTTSDVGDNTEYEIQFNIIFLDRQSYSLSSGGFVVSNDAYWEQDLSFLFYDGINFGVNHPITLQAQVFDPSQDDVQISLGHSESKTVIFTSNNFILQNESFTVDNVNYNINLFEQNGQHYASVYAEKLAQNTYLANNSFPVNTNLEYLIIPLIDLYDILENRMGLTEVSIVGCIESKNIINGDALDDDGGYTSTNLSIDTRKDIVFETLNPRILHDIGYESSPEPFGVISSFLPTAYEGERIKFTSKINNDCIGLHYKWDFSDGYTVNAPYAEHAWQMAGVYNISLTIADAYGNFHTDVKNITILSKAPEIVGPFGFQATEGSALLLDVEVYDSERDESLLEYSWFDEKNQLFSHEPKPQVILDNGKYEYTLIVTDSSGTSSSQKITINVHSLAPQVFIGNYMYHGVSSDEYELFSSDGEIKLRAWAMDTQYDMGSLKFIWEIRKGNNKFYMYDSRGNYYSDVIFTCTETGIYQGRVTVVDPEGKKNTASFKINSVIDNTLNGISDNVEDMLELADGTSDADGDGLTDTYEQTISNTSYLDPDTDGDGLWDGYTINSTLGELSVDTDNLDYDTDNDYLSDGNELYGWNITVVYFENSSTFHVSADPLDNNSDSDGLSDYEEFLAGSNPQLSDTDNDQLDDDIDPFPTKWDGDEDTLSDYWEIQYGTDPNNTDSDQDGLKDGEEVYGWGIGFYTNPLDADSDHDFVSDSAEIKNYLIKLADEGFDDLDKKVNLTASSTLHFPHHFTQASAAQISFGISFGEYGTNATGSYGVSDQEVLDLQIIITKKDNGIILANFSTNNTRYFSQVVDVTEIMNNITLGYDYYGDYEIGIIYPDNTTLEGHYPATYSFEDDTVGGLPNGWTSYEGSYCDVSVLESLDGHAKIVRLKDSNAYTTHFALIENSFSSQTNGTVEFWVRRDGYTEEFRVGRMCQDDTLGIELFHKGGSFRVSEDGGAESIVADFDTDRWYHIRYNFECNGDYFYLYIDGQSYGKYYFYDNVTALNKIVFHTRGWGTYNDYYVFVDSVGYSWDPGYYVGDNEEEFVSTYRFYENGVYCGTYSFTDDTVGGLPAEWDSWEGDYCDVEVIESVDGHANVVELFDTAPGPTANARIENSFSPQSNGTIEFWVRRDGYSEIMVMEAREGDLSSGTSAVNILHKGGSFRVTEDGGAESIVADFEADRWYHIRYDFECDGDYYYLYIDGQSYGKYYFYDNVTSISSINFRTRGYGTFYDFWLFVDAIGYSWDELYNIGDNRFNGNPKCYLEYFELDFSRYLDPNDSDSDNDGILDGVEMGVLVNGTDIIEIQDYYAPYLVNGTQENMEIFNVTLNPIGNYSGSFSFENEEDGTSGTNIDFIDSISVDSNCQASILSEFGYHNKVLELSDDNSNGNVEVYNTQFERSNGTIEFYWAQSAEDKFSEVIFYDGSTMAISLKMRENGQFSWYDGSYHDIKVYSSNGWYHHKIVFNCSAGTKGKFDWYINGELEAENINFYQSNCVLLDKLMLSTGQSSANFDVYFDAIGYCWYIINHSYYWEGENLGDTIPDSFEVGLYPLYPGTYSFTGENGEDQDDIDFIDSYNKPSSTTIQVIEEKDGHNEVLELYDNNYIAGVGYIYAVNEFDAQTNGTVEFWYRTTNYHKMGKIEFLSGSTSKFSVGVLHEYFYYVSGYNWVGTPENNKWLHFKIKFDCNTGKFNWYVDDSLIAENISFSSSSIDKIRLGTLSNDGGYYNYYDAFGFSWDPFYEIGDNKYIQFPSLDHPDEYYLEISQTGEVTDAQLDIEISSVGTPNGTGQVFIYLIKDVLNLTKSDICLMIDTVSFNSSAAFSYSKSLDLGAYCNDGTIYGTYQLQIKLYGTKVNNLFNLSTFKIEADTYVPANFEDTVGWVTDPANNDTDGDGWSDYYEIFTSGTSPLSKDSDGDEANDPEDRDPLHDVMLEIHPYTGEYNNLAIGDGHALMQVVVAFSFGENDYYIVTPVTQGTSAPNIYGSYQACYFDEHYYVNIDDDTTRQGNTITMNLQLYSVYRHLGSNDIKGVDEDAQYTIDTSGEYTILFEGDTGRFGFPNYVRVKVKTVYIEKANTLAIFEANSTFNGHYNDWNQHYSVIQLNIPGEGHYLGSESFLDSPIGNCSIDIDFVTSDSSSVESYVKIYEEIDGHSQVLGVSEGDSDHSNFYHQFDAGHAHGSIEWWWYSTKANGGVLNFYLQNGGTDVIRLYIRDGKIKRYYGGNYYDVMSVSSDTWYRMRVDFACDSSGYNGLSIYHYDVYVDGVQKVSDGGFVSNQGQINRIQISTGGDAFTGYFDAFGFSWEPDYTLGDNEDHYDCSGTPFEYGMNVIIIPTSLFTQTHLNGYVEHGTLNETVLYHEEEYMFEFTGPDRDGESEKANADVDFVFIRRGISPEDALAVLELVLNGVINETLDESNNTIYINATIHSYVSTKLNGTEATEMNLPYSVLGYIPWVNNYTNSAMGDEPDPEGAFDFVLWFLCLVNPILRVVLNAQMAMTGGKFFAYLQEFLATIFMNALGFLAQLLWVIARAALLVLAYVLLAIHIFMQILIYITSGIALLVLTSFMGGYTEFSWNFVEFSVYSRVFRMESEVKWYYWDFFDMKFPWVVDKVYNNGTLTFTTELDVLFGNEVFNGVNNSYFEINEPQGPPSLHCSFNHVSGATYEFWTLYDDSGTGDNPPDANYGVRLHLIAPNGTAIEPLSMNVHEDYLPDPDYSKPVNYTYVVDLSTIYELDGLWHYFFTTKDNFSDQIVFKPVGSYLLGPCISTSDLSYVLEYSTIQTSKNEWYTSAGFKNENFTFKTWYYGSEAPSNVSLCLIPANISNGFGGVNKTVGIRKFLMTPSVVYPNYSAMDPVEFNKTLNFSNLGYNDNEIGWFHHYFEVEFSDGSLSYLYGDSYDESNSSIEVDLKGPYVVKDEDKPVLLGVKCYNLLGDYWRISTDYTSFLFEATFMSPDNYDLMEGYPRIIFTDGKGRESQPFYMEDVIYEYELGVYACAATVNLADLGAGKWFWRIEAKDEYGVAAETVTSGDSYIYNLGNPIDMTTCYTLTSSLSGFLPLVFYGAAAVAAWNPDSSASTVLTVLGCASAIISSIIMIKAAVDSENPFMILGTATALLLNSFFLSFSGVFKERTIDWFNLFGDLGDESIMSFARAKFGKGLASPLGSTIKTVLRYTAIMSLLASALSINPQHDMLSFIYDISGVGTLLNMIFTPIQIVVNLLSTIFVRTAFDAVNLIDEPSCKTKVKFVSRNVSGTGLLIGLFAVLMFIEFLEYMG